MTPFRWLVAGSCLAVVAGLASCAELVRGEPVPCEHDADCAHGFVCAGQLRDICVAVIECTGDSECPVGSSCIERTASAPDNPFESEHATKQVCDCLSECGSGGFNAGGAPPEGGQGGSGGTPEGGAGGQGGAQ